ncbi:hypothetical protein MIND_01249900 [Mycena indigotica]|uniref:Uncharacterized protein n=1 Tax=Mycena indigotica TaxID=2126181 RepID=A0A8H6S6J1_9AGAR|nr:uncharacterized protein MIND_01249900 [Mycena indigotica]KAF7292225.1 hypothetical protein MIND_01249900 [Mycena indigotica]
MVLPAPLSCQCRVFRRSWVAILQPERRLFIRSPTLLQWPETGAGRRASSSENGACVLCYSSSAWADLFLRAPGLPLSARRLRQRRASRGGQLTRKRVGARSGYRGVGTVLVGDGRWTLDDGGIDEGLTPLSSVSPLHRQVMPWP